MAQSHAFPRTLRYFQSYPLAPPALVLLLMAWLCALECWGAAGGPQASLVPTKPLIPQAEANATSPRVLPNSLLFTITIAKTKRSVYTMGQMRTLVALCDLGFSVKAVLHTFDKEWSKTGLFHPGALWCHRLMRDIEVEVRVLPKKLRLRLAAQHRHTVWEHKDRYEWFLYMEDDMDIRPHHITNLMDEHRRLSGTRFMPGLRRIEVNSSYMATYPQGMRAFFTDGCLGQVARIRGSLFYLPRNSYWASWFMPRTLLLEYLGANPNWLREAQTYKHMYNIRVHFAHLWVKHTTVVPLANFHEYFINHSPNNYIDDYHYQAKFAKAGTPTCFAYQLLQRLGLVVAMGGSCPFAPSPHPGAVNWEECLHGDNLVAGLPSDAQLGSLNASSLCRPEQLREAAAAG